MSLNAGLVEATADLNMRRFSQGMRKMKMEGASTSANVTGSLDGIGHKLTSLGFMAKAFFSGALVMGAKNAVREFALLEGATAKFDVVFGELSKEMHSWVDSYRTQVPLARREIIQMSAALQDLLIPLGINRTEATKMTKEWLELAGALAAFNDVNVTEVLDAMQSAIAGQSRPLRRFGIDVRETSLQQTALEHGIIQTGDAMNETARQQALLIQAYAQSKDAIDGYEDQLGTTLMMEQELGATFKDTIALIGEELQPAYNALIKDMIRLIRVMSDNIETAKTWIGILRGVSTVLMPLQKVSDAITDVGRSAIDSAQETRRFREELVRGLSGDLGVDEIAKLMSDLNNEMMKADAKGFRGVANELYGASLALAEIRDRMISVNAQAQQTTVIPEISPDQLASLARARQALIDIRSELRPTQPMDFILDDDGELIQRAVDHMNAYGMSFDEAMKAVRSAPPDFEEFMNMVYGSALSADELSHRLGDVSENAEKATEAARFFTRTLADGLEQVLFNARSVEDAIKGIGRQLASRAITTGLMALFSGGLPTGKNFFQAMFGGSFHTGGIVPGVGEKMINVKGGEMVLTRDQIKGIQMGSSQRDIRLTVNIRGDLQGRGDTLRAIIDEQVRQTVRLA